MAIPWRLALMAIPWQSILANAPTILRSANALLKKTGDTPGTTLEPRAWLTDVQALAARVDALEQRDRETAELLSRVTTQITDLATAAEVLEARSRWLLVLATSAMLIALTTAGILLVAR